jgi:N-formylglutamate amidohydrolase
VEPAPLSNDKKNVFISGLSSLTPTEEKIYNLYLQNKTTKEIMELLEIKENTLKYHNKNIYDGLLSFEEAQQRIQNVYDQYHKRLKQLVDRCVRKFGFCLLIDCHSMPSMICNIMNESKMLDFCICNLFDESCPIEMSQRMMQNLSKQDFRVEFNKPYAGAFITFNYCQPRKNIYTMQLEVNRACYMNEKNLKKNKHFQTIAAHISNAIIDLGHFLLDLKK